MGKNFVKFVPPHIVTTHIRQSYPIIVPWESEFFAEGYPDKSYVEWNKVEKSTVVPMCYEGSDDEEEVNTNSENNENNNNYFYKVSNLESKDEAEENVFDDQIENEIEVNHAQSKIDERDEKFACIM